MDLDALQKSQLVRQRVLLVEDDPQGAQLLKMVLEDLGVIEVVHAGDGQQAWDAFSVASDPFTVVISDWNMPGMTGLQLLEKVRAVSRTIPFIMITGRGLIDSAVEAKTHGVTAYISKPYTPQQIVSKLLGVIDKE